VTGVHKNGHEVTRAYTRKDSVRGPLFAAQELAAGGSKHRGKQSFGSSLALARFVHLFAVRH